MNLPFSLHLIEEDGWINIASDEQGLVLVCSLSTVPARKALQHALVAAYNGSRLVLPDGLKAPRIWPALQFHNIVPRGIGLKELGRNSWIVAARPENAYLLLLVEIRDRFNRFACTQNKMARAAKALRVYGPLAAEAELLR